MACFDFARRLVRIVRQIGDRRIGLLAIVGLRFERDVAAGQARFHLQHFFGLDVQLAGDHVDLGWRKAGTVRVGVGRIALQALLHRTQVEEQLALRLGGRDLHHAPVAQDVFMDLGLDPVQRIADQTHALGRVEAAHRLHQTDVAFLDQVALRQAITQVLP